MWADRNTSGEAVDRLVLASASPRRSELLGSVGISPLIVPADVDESSGLGETAISLVERLARDKAEAVSPQHGGCYVLGADTIVTIDGHILGKPADDDDARRMLRMLSGRHHQVFTGVAVAFGDITHSALAETAVEFHELNEEDIENYLESGEHRGKAGAYAIQGRGGLFVRHIAGTYDNVVGLPLGVVDEVLALHGQRLRDFWQ